MIAIGMWCLLGLVAGLAPSLLAQERYRPWWARRWWWVSFGLAACLALPFGLVLIMFLSDGSFDAIGELGTFFVSEEFGWVTAIAATWLMGSGATAWAHRKAPRLQGPPLSDDVMALAREPETVPQAVALYQHETGVDLPVAMDAVEEYVESQRRARARGEIPAPAVGAIERMYLGFAAAWYVVLAAAYVLTFPSHGNHFVTALGFFVFVPALFGGFCGVCGGAVSQSIKAALKKALESGSLTPRYAFAAGVVSAAVSIAAVVAVGSLAFSLSQSEISVLIALAGVGTALAASPFLGLWLLNKKTAQ